jgi:hypothetical protein
VPATPERGGLSAIARQAWLGLIVAAVGWALFLVASGGIDLRPHGIPVRSTDPDRAAYGALILAALYAAVHRAHAHRHAHWIEAHALRLAAVLERRRTTIVAAMAVMTFVVGVTHGALVAGGSDSYGYVSQADLWLAGDPVVEQALATQVPWPDADATFAPLGYVPSPQRGAIVPSYAPGLAVLMAILKVAFGGCGPFLVVPFLGGLTVWLTYVLGKRAGSAGAGLLSAALIVTSPAFLFMLFNPMSDVPVTAFFTAGLVVALSPGRWRAFWTGVVVSLGIFVRPNLVPVGAVYLAVLLARAPAGERWRTLVLFGLGGLPGVSMVAAANTIMYGAPWRSGYGSLDQYYSWSFFVTNLQHYVTWLVTTETPFIALFIVPIALLRRRDGDRRIAVKMLALLIAAVWVSYLFYLPFDVWWYLRFLLPAFPAMLVLAVIGGALVLARYLTAPRTLAVGVVLALALLAYRAGDVRELGLQELWRGGIVYSSAGEYVRTKLPENAVILTVQHSGSLRYHGHRLTMRWDLLGPEWWPRALDVLTERGYRPYLLVSDFEEEQLRRHLGMSAAPDAPGTIVAEMLMPEVIRIYDPLRQSGTKTDTIPEVVACPCALTSAPAD